MKRLIVFLAIPVLLPSCSSMYIPAVRSIPLLAKKGEFLGEAGVSTNSIYANGSYAFTNDIAASVTGNLSYRNFSNRYDLFTDIYEAPPSAGFGSFFEPVDTRGKFAHRYGEISVGKINMLPPAKKPKLEIFGGAGMGRATDIDYFDSGNRYKCAYYSFFGQGNFGLKKRVIEIGGSLRLICSTFNYAVDSYDYSEVLYQNKFYAFHLEPMGFTRIGSGNLKIVFRYGINLAIPINLVEEDVQYRGFDAPVGIYGWDNTFFHLSVGLSYRIGGNSNVSK